MKISVAFTARNEANLIGTTLADAVQELEAQRRDYEIIVVDNASSDDTAAIAERFAETHPQVRVIRHPTNLGYAHSTLTAYQNSTGDFIAVVDADGQLTLRDLPKFLEIIDAGADIVYGWRKPRNDPAFRKVITFGLQLSAKRMLGWRLHDINCGFRVSTANFAHSVTHVIPVNYIGPELWVHALNHGYRVDEVIVEHFERKGGTSIHIPWRLPVTIAGAYKYLGALKKQLPAVDATPAKPS